MIIKGNTSRMMGDYHVRFCERLAGETPACLLGASYDSFVVQQSLVLRMNICGKNRQLLVAANRQTV